MARRKKVLPEGEIAENKTLMEQVAEADEMAEAVTDELQEAAEKEAEAPEWTSTLDVKPETAVAVTDTAEVAGQTETEEKEEAAAVQAQAPQNETKRMVLAGIAIVLQLLAMIFMATHVNFLTPLAELGVRVLALLFVLGIYSQNKASSIKLPWIILILLAPVLGVSLFLLNGNAGSTKKMRLRYALIEKKLLPKLPQNHTVLARLKDLDHSVGNAVSYVKSFAGFPVYQNTDTAYYPTAREALDAQLEAMKAAEKFIFMEYHAIEDGEVFREIEEVLEERVKAGVEVRIFYDDLGSSSFISHDFAKRMQEKGIACRAFNPVGPVLKFFLNSRDHRKLTIIDGKVGFTGGFNLTDECFNITQPYGEWKDTGIRIAGDAVRSMTMTFLEMWNAVREDDVDDRDCDLYLQKESFASQEDGYVQPFADTPLENENIAENIYINLIELSRQYIWFTTPYLIITDEMSHALCLAAKRGVDVRIVTPAVPDKKTDFNLTRSYYHELAKAGVKVYEFTPGFMHAKQCVTDDKACVCGTLNLDYRSLYNHFENGCLIYGSHVVDEMKKDFEEIMRVSTEVTEDYRSGMSSFMRIKQLVMRLFASLL